MTVRNALLGSAAAVAFALPAAAEMRPTLSFMGVTGLIDMPSGEQQSDGMLSFTAAYFGPIGRQTLTFQFTPRWSGSFRYSSGRNWDQVVDSPFATYYDRSFDLRYLITEEGQYVPAITVGFQDFIGTSLSQAEYIVATKTFNDKVKVTAGLGWGRLGSYGSMGAPFGERDPVDIGNGGTPHLGNWFKGDVAPFAGVEWKVTDRLTFKAEYSSDAYTEEAGIRQTFERNSPFNFGLDYRLTNSIDFGIYSLYGSEIGASLNIMMNPYRRPQGGILGPGPVVVGDRPAATGWGPEWVTDKGQLTALQNQTAALLRHDGIAIEQMAVTQTNVQIRINSTQLDNSAQAIGRTARALAATMPPSVGLFEIVPMVRGVPVSKVVIKRSDIEQLQFAANQDALMQERTQILPISGARPADPIAPPDLAPRFTWNLAPYIGTTLFNPENPLDINGGLSLKARYQLAPGLFLTGTVTKRIGGSSAPPAEEDTTDDSGLPPIRTEGDKYASFGDPAIKTLTLNWYAKPAPNVFTRVSAGYLETMFGGVSTEVLWMPVDKPYAFGFELDVVQQRGYDQMLDFLDYRAGVGFVSGYYMWDNGINAELDVGRFLAGDYGARIVLDRQFANGWKVGAFATFTSASFDEFGEGSFDKGIIVEIPFGWFLGKPTQQVSRVVMRPLLRNGGAGLDLDGRLYDNMRDFRQQDLDFAWGRFWR